MHLSLAQAVVTSAAEKFVSQGLLGSAVVILVGALIYLWRYSTQREDFWLQKLQQKDADAAAERQRLQDKISELSASRTQDAQAVTQRLQEIVSKSTEALTSASAMLQSIPAATQALQEGFRDLTTEVIREIGNKTRR